MAKEFNTGDTTNTSSSDDDSEVTQLRDNTNPQQTTKENSSNDNGGATTARTRSIATSNDKKSTTETNNNSSPVHQKVFALLHDAGVITSSMRLNSATENNQKNNKNETISRTTKTRYHTIRALCGDLFHHFQTRNWKRKVVTITMMIIGILVLTDLFFVGYIKIWLIQFLQWMEHNIAGGIFVFIVLLIFTTFVMIPPTILVFGCGFAFANVFNYYLGFAIVCALLASFLGCIVGAVLSFHRARYVTRDIIHVFSKRFPIVRAADRAISRKGFRVMLLLRLCPLIPFNALNYIGGITGIDIWRFTGALVGILPAQIITVTIGATAGSFSSYQYRGNDEQWAVQMGTIITGLGLAFLAIIMTYLFAKKELQKELDREKAQIEAEQLKVQAKALESQADGGDNDLEMGKYDDPQGRRKSGERIRWDYDDSKEDGEWFWVWA